MSVITTYIYLFYIILLYIIIDSRVHEVFQNEVCKYFSYTHYKDNHTM